MKIITLKVEDKIYEKFTWLLNHFEKNEIEIINEISDNDLQKVEKDELLDIDPLKGTSINSK